MEFSLRLTGCALGKNETFLILFKFTKSCEEDDTTEDNVKDDNFGDKTFCNPSQSCL